MKQEFLLKEMSDLKYIWMSKAFPEQTVLVLCKAQDRKTFPC